MNKHLTMAVAIFWLASPLVAQERSDIIQQRVSAQPASTQSQSSEDRAGAASRAPEIAPAASIASPPDARPLGTASGTLHDLSPWSMFLSADALVKAVMISLAFASFVTWTIFLARSAKLNLGQWHLERSLARISTATTLAEAQLALGRRRNVLSSLLAAATQEIRNSTDGLSERGVKVRVASTFNEILRTEARAARQGLGLIATIGSTAPFVG